MVKTLTEESKSNMKETLSTCTVCLWENNIISDKLNRYHKEGEERNKAHAIDQTRPDNNNNRTRMCSRVWWKRLTKYNNKLPTCVSTDGSGRKVEVNGQRNDDVDVDDVLFLCIRLKLPSRPKRISTIDILLQTGNLHQVEVDVANSLRSCRVYCS